MKIILPTSKQKVISASNLEPQMIISARFEAGLNSGIVKLSEIETKYYYLKTKLDFKAVLNVFKKGRHRHLHISCIGGAHTIWTSFDPINYDDIGLQHREMLYKDKHHHFACAVANVEQSKSMVPGNIGTAIIRLTVTIAFKYAAIMWASFYHLMFNDEEQGTAIISRAKLLNNLQKIVNNFDAPLDYFSISKSNGIADSLKEG